jgi:hypothetical protein
VENKTEMTCDKITYDTYQEANGAAHGISRDSKGSMKAYRCNDCGKYHLCSAKSKINKKKKRMWDVQTAPITPYRNKKNGKRMEPNPGFVYKQKQEPVYATEKLLSKEQAAFLKRLIEGKNHMEKAL